MCKHDLTALIGTARGIECRDCGAVFADFTELEADRAAQGAENAPAPAEKKAAEKPAAGRKKK